jgi:hypothetical protein
MKVLALTSQKGGSGKTTLAGHLAVAAEAAGAGPVALIDTDPQGSLTDWWNARDAHTPAFLSASVESLEADLARARDLGFALVVIDTPPAITDMIERVIALPFGTETEVDHVLCHLYRMSNRLIEGTAIPDARHEPRDRPGIRRLFGR